MLEADREDELAHDDRHTAISELITRHEWSLLPEKELVKCMLAALPVEIPPDELDRLIKRQYFGLLYDACQQTSQRDLHERAYTDLFRYLYRIAYNKYQDIAEETTQRALLIIYEHIDQCRARSTFNGFVVSKLRQATTDVLRAKRGAGLLGEQEEPDIPDGRLPIVEALIKEECLKALAEALGRLKDVQQRTIILKYFQKLADEEISMSLNMTKSSVRVTRHRSLQQLREDRRLREACPENEYSL